MSISKFSWPPASSSRTFQSGFSDRRDAIAHPADPAPTTIKSNSVRLPSFDSSKSSIAACRWPWFKKSITDDNNWHWQCTNTQHNITKTLNACFELILDTWNLFLYKKITKKISLSQKITQKYLNSTFYFLFQILAVFIHCTNANWCA